MPVSECCHPQRREQCNRNKNCPIIDERDVEIIALLLSEHDLGSDEFEEAVRGEEALETDPEIILEALIACAHFREEATTYFDKLQTCLHYNFDGTEKRPDPNDTAAVFRLKPHRKK